MLPYEVRECHEPPPEFKLVVPEREPTPPPYPRYVPEPATPPGPDEPLLTSEAIRAKFAQVWTSDEDGGDSEARRSAAKARKRAVRVRVARKKRVVRMPWKCRR